ncbi:hypothetical protein QE152_g30992 [Popillia japonica]|uniref:Uncharacterized protein n=1 Tax=Popillia japonica TaxID=7064 RepID=A0AAW1JD97_POPJA
MWGYYETIIPRYLPEDFQRNFRLTPAAFEALCARLIPIMREGYTTGRPLYKPEKKIQKTIPRLFYWDNPGNFFNNTFILGDKAFNLLL